MLRRMISYCVAYIRNPARLRGITALPTLLNLPITDNCNSRCIMCDVWKTRARGEMTPADLGRVLRDPLFRRLRHVGISGGEPTLRKDLVEAVQEVLAACPNLASLSITTHAFHPRRWAKMLPPIKALCKEADVRFTLNISIDGDEHIHNEVRRISGGYGKCLETCAVAQESGVPVQFQGTISAANVYNLGAMLDRADDQGATPVFRQATVIERLANRESMASVSLTPAHKSFFADFLRSKRLAEATSNPARRLFYQDLSRRLVTGARRKAPCYFQREGLVLAANGDLFHCSISSDAIGNALKESAYNLYFSARSEVIRGQILTSICPNCVHDQSGAWSPAALAAETLRATVVGRSAKHAVRALRFGAGVVFERLRALRCQRRPTVPARCERVAIIGAYGGEHVGDAAILGGVMLRLKAQHGTRSVTVLSTRPDRTRTWTDGLDLPMRIGVASYESDAERVLKESDALVYGGGPVMDLPELVVQHLRAATTMRALGRPFLVEGVGIGPFRSRIVRGVARALLESASHVSVRGQASRRDPLLRHCQVEVGLDPAFDYLKTRVRRLTKVRERTSRAIGWSTEADSDAVVIGINLRPLWKKYGGSEAHLRELHGRAIDSMIDGLIDAQRRIGRQVHAVFFPMNADVYGFSDLSVARALSQAAQGRLSLRVCEQELMVDEVLLLLSKVHLVVAMRLHAAIFGLAAGCPTIGIDYRVGRAGKVTELLSEHGLRNRVTRIDLLTPIWLGEQVAAAAAEGIGPSGC